MIHQLAHFPSWTVSEAQFSTLKCSPGIFFYSSLRASRHLFIRNSSNHGSKLLGIDAAALLAIHPRAIRQPSQEAGRGGSKSSANVCTPADTAFEHLFQST